jgi:purine-binding chemotaxis protein CheW
MKPSIDWQRTPQRLKAGKRSPEIEIASEQERMEAVWRQRAVRLARRPVPAGAGPDALPVMVLGIGNERYGVELADVAEVLPQVHLTPIPGTPRHLSGVINVHGEIRPVIDLRRLLGLAAAEKGGVSRVILLRMQGREMGLQVDGVEEIRWVAAGELRSAADSDSDLSASYVKGLTGDTLIVLSTEALFAGLLTGTRS